MTLRVVTCSGVDIGMLAREFGALLQYLKKKQPKSTVPSKKKVFTTIFAIFYILFCALRKFLMGVEGRCPLAALGIFVISFCKCE